MQGSRGWPGTPGNRVGAHKELLSLRVASAKEPNSVRRCTTASQGASGKNVCPGGDPPTPPPRKPPIPGRRSAGIAPQRGLRTVVRSASARTPDRRFEPHPTGGQPGGGGGCRRRPDELRTSGKPLARSGDPLGWVGDWNGRPKTRTFRHASPADDQSDRTSALPLTHTTIGPDARAPSIPRRPVHMHRDAPANAGGEHAARRHTHVANRAPKRAENRAHQLSLSGPSGLCV